MTSSPISSLLPIVVALSFSLLLLLFRVQLASFISNFFVVVFLSVSVSLWNQLIGVALLFPDTTWRATALVGCCGNKSGRFKHSSFQLDYG